MKKLSSSELRQLFLDFFKEKGHHIEKSASLVPVEDPTLLWINSGVATMKKYFDGSVKPENPRIASSQKSIRTNDIENVGVTARHHTLFEMLGNFSIGDYFKEEAIEWAWEFLTGEKWLALDPKKLYITVYPEDVETYSIWRDKIGVAESHLIQEEGNFWDIGEGPCGPDTEIFFDRGEAFSNLPEGHEENYPGGENERWLEIWNLVFSEFNHKADDTYAPLPNKNIDTGMGLERIVSVMQNAPTNFETDLFMPIIHKVEKLSGKNYEKEKNKVSFKVIADHIRTLVFAISDGALPSNEGRGYVLRRLLRRSVMHGRRLSIEKPFLTQLVPVVVEIMGVYYPEVSENSNLIEKVILSEEKRFHETLSDGLNKVKEIVEELKANGQSEISGKDVFQLYDTYGFPLELTEEVVEEEDITINYTEFEVEMQKQRERARSARQAENSMAVQSSLLSEVSVDSAFIGYDHDEASSELIKLIKNDAFVEEAEPGEAVRLIFNESPFYAEKGGQVGDTGLVLDKDNNVMAEVLNVKSGPEGQPIHEVKVRNKLHNNNTYHLIIDKHRRRLIERNHTATHLLHQALKDILGSHVNQAGSLVEDSQLRFDFTHFNQVTEKELKEMEKQVNQKILENISVETVETTIDKAKEMGAIALFGEKYGKHVRVISINDYSKELCGGTHVKTTSEIGLFKILSESGIGAGTRRIIARTSQGAYQWIDEQLSVLNQTTKLMKLQSLNELPVKVEGLQKELKDINQMNESLSAKLAEAQAEDTFKNISTVEGFTVIAEEIKAKDMNQLRKLADKWKQNDYSDILVLGLRNEGKVNLIAALTEKATQNNLKAKDLIKTISPYIKGGGGGRDDFAQAGGKNPEGLEKALQSVSTWIEATL
ncbi:alanine--tRNA ligase [Alkalibacterium kapii]|uniref:Alanine--tRNA ligase n=1 Tax=Alkalibacterium kapii TaxID=426704 RepID=A0A511ATF4_9LACT|nr:alanine--tRNA ligase [Alkalibacterium kapii]GEK91489.1 alanine--tRNA ligase [Alkalibacterium kapii]